MTQIVSSSVPQDMLHRKQYAISKITVSTGSYFSKPANSKGYAKE